MKQNLVVDRLHVIHDMQANSVRVTETFRAENEAFIKELTVEKIVDDGSGTFYGVTDEIKELTVDPALNHNSAGVVDKAARVDHVHAIPETIKNPHLIRVNKFDGTELFTYDGSVEKTIDLSLENTGAAQKNHAVNNSSFGLGSNTVYGHLKLTDATNSTYSTNNAVAATPLAVFNTVKLCRTVWSNAAPTANVVAGTFWVGLNAL